MQYQTDADKRFRFPSFITTHMYPKMSNSLEWHKYKFYLFYFNAVSEATCMVSQIEWIIEEGKHFSSKSVLHIVLQNSMVTAVLRST